MARGHSLPQPPFRLGPLAIRTQEGWTPREEIEPLPAAGEVPRASRLTRSRSRTPRTTRSRLLPHPAGLAPAEVAVGVEQADHRGFAPIDHREGPAYCRIKVASPQPRWARPLIRWIFVYSTQAITERVPGSRKSRRAAVS